MSHERPPPANQAGPGAGLQHTGSRGEGVSPPAQAALFLPCLSPPSVSLICIFHRTPNIGASLQQRWPGDGVTAALPWSSVGMQRSPPHPASREASTAAPLPTAVRQLGWDGAEGLPAEMHVLCLQGVGPAQGVLLGAGVSGLSFSAWISPLIW